MKVTEKQAQRVLAAVREQCAGWIDPEQPDTGPKLVMDFDWMGTGSSPAIVWEEGPFEWTYRFPEGGIDEELTGLAREFTPDAIVKTKDVSDKIPSGVWTEACTAWALSIYPCD